MRESFEMRREIWQVPAAPRDLAVLLFSASSRARLPFCFKEGKAWQKVSIFMHCKFGYKENVFALMHLRDAFGPALHAWSAQTKDLKSHRTGADVPQNLLILQCTFAMRDLSKEIILKFLIRRVHESPMQPTSSMHPTLFLSLSPSLFLSVSLNLQLLHTGT